MLRVCDCENSLLIVLQVFTKYQILFISFDLSCKIVNKRPKESLNIILYKKLEQLILILEKYLKIWDQKCKKMFL